MKTRVLLASGILLASASTLLANGGGYFRGGVENTGDVAGFEPKATENIRILDEKLTVKLGAKEADVEVRYLMKNVTDKKVKVRFGFPVEESIDSELMTDKPSVPDPKKLKYCKGYAIEANGKTLKSTWNGESKDIRDKRFKGIAGWMVSELSFAGSEEKSVRIRFQSSYPEEEWGVSDDSSLSAAVFKYRLSTAACWAGTIGEGRLEFIANGINSDDIKPLKPVNRFKKDGDKWVWHFKELEPSLADDIEFESRPAESIYYGRTPDGKHINADTKNPVSFIERAGQWSTTHQNYKATASSTLASEGDHSYGPANLNNHNANDAWSEGASGNGTGEWLEIVPEQPKPLLSINMQHGYQNGTLFNENARPKKAVIQLNDEHKFETVFPDQATEVPIPVTNYRKPVRKIRITFTEVYPGSKFEDLCVTSIRLHVRLDKKPKLEPTR